MTTDREPTRAQRIYIAGPMRGLPLYNFPAFDKAAENWRAMGWAVVSPAEHDRELGFDPAKTVAEQGFDLAAAFRWDIESVLACEAIYMLPGWTASEGARLEHGVAKAIGLRVMYEAEPGSGYVGPAYVDHRGQPLQWGKTERREVDPVTGGEKGAKLAELGAIDPAALYALAEVAGYGGQKYARSNYLKGYRWSLSFDACLRHLLAFWGGEDVDPESGLSHAGHAAWHCLALVSFAAHGLGTDDRWLPPRFEVD